jgi:hypothetical protein
LIAFQALLYIQAILITIAFFLTVSFGMYEAGMLLISATLKLSVATLFLCFFLYDAEKQVENQEDKISESKEHLKKYALCVHYLNHWKVYQNHLFNLEGLLLYPLERLDLLEQLVHELKGIQMDQESSRLKALSLLFALERYQIG